MNLSPLILIGFMGVGKTSVAKVLANRLNAEIYDIDALIEAQYGNISKLITSHGEPHFRGIEHQVFSEAIQYAPAIISTGGGIVTHEPSQQLLQKEPNVIWLQASYEVVELRVKGDVLNQRPLADHNMRKRFNVRQSMYERCASFTVSVDGLGVEEVAEKIINRYG